MQLDPALIAFIQWLINQGAAVAIALLVLWRLDQRLSTLEQYAQRLADQQMSLLAWLSRANGPVPSPPK